MPQVIDQAAEARRALAKKHSKTIAEQAESVADSRDRLVAAVAVAQETLIGLVNAATAHSDVIRRHAAELAAQGFTGVPDGCEVGSDPKAGVVVLGGETARVLDPEIVLRHVVERVQLAQFAPREYHRVHLQGRGRIDNAASAAIVGLVEAPKPPGRDEVA